MAPNPKVKEAFKAMKAIGIPEVKTKPVLKRLLKLFDKNWDLIEEENYRVLADAIFEYEDTEAAEKEKKKTPGNTDQGEAFEEAAQMQDDEPERPLKRLRLKHQGPAAPSHGQSSPMSGACALKIPKPEPGEVEASLTEMVPPMTGSPQSNAGNRRTESHSVSPQVPVRNKGKQPVSPQNLGVNIDRAQPSAPVRARDRMRESSKPHTAETDKRAAPERPSQVLKLKEPKVEPGIVPTEQQKQPQINALIKPKDEPFTDDMVSLEPLAVILPDHMHKEAPSKFTNLVVNQDGQGSGASKPVDGNDKGVETLASLSVKAKHLPEADVSERATTNIEIAASPLGEVKISLSCDPGVLGQDFQVPDLQSVFEKVNDSCLKTYKIVDPEFSVRKMMREFCECVMELGTNADNVTQEKFGQPDSRVVENNGICSLPSMNGSVNVQCSGSAAATVDMAVPDASNPTSASKCPQVCMQSNKNATGDHCAERDSIIADINLKSLAVQQRQLDPAAMRYLYDTSDVTKGEEAVKVPLENSNCESLPSFRYISRNVVSHKADVIFSLSQIGDQDCCLSCHGDCLPLSPSCNCGQQNGGESPYTSDGLVREDFLEACISMVRKPQKHYLMYCKECPLERLKNEDMLDPCKGHLKRKFMKECWTKCGCSKYCGNRVVQRGIRCNLQVFWTPEGKGWGLRTLEDLPKGTFVCEYVGEILTITELHKRNLRRSNDRHSYSVLLDADWGRRALKEEEILCLDATLYGNIARFINHRCSDANLIEIPVEVETPNHHYYHVALFTTRKVNAFEELTWDYGVDFDDSEHHIKAFRCLCGSEFCRNMKRSSRSRSALSLQ